MLDCLPPASDLSPESQYLLTIDHLQAMRHHLEAIEKALAAGAASLIAAMPHLAEISNRSHDAHDLLQALSRQSNETLSALGGRA